MSVADKMLLDRDELDELATLLETVRDVVDELSIALAGDAVHQRQFGMPRSGQPKSTPPYPIELEHCRDELINELSTAVRDICEHRATVYDGPTYPAGLAAWLKRNRIALALMEQGPDIHKGLVAVLTRANRAVGRHETPYIVRQSMVEEANRQIVTAGQCERIESLRKHGKLDGQQDGESWFYRLGDVLKAHSEAKLYSPRRRGA